VLSVVPFAGGAVGVVSGAGCPAVADPGADVVAIAQRKGYKVVSRSVCLERDVRVFVRMDAVFC